MAELWSIAVSGPTIFPTLFLAVIILYWISVIVGALDMDLFDVDIDVSPDVDADADVDIDAEATAHGVSSGPFQAALIFFNLADIPLMLFISFWVLLTWVGTVTLEYLLGSPGTVLSFVILFGNIFTMLFAAKIITTPLKGILKKSNDISKRKTVGQLCKLLSDLEPGRLGQGEVKTGEAPLVVNVMTRPDCSMKKGQTALIIEKNNEKNFFIIEPFNDWEA
jgi:hypothetical protein